MSPAEHWAYMVTFNATDGEVAETFRWLDRNGDGYLSTEELLQNTEEFFCRDDAQAPGYG